MKKKPYLCLGKGDEPTETKLTNLTNQTDIYGYVYHALESGDQQQ